MTDNQIVALQGLYRAGHDEGVYMHYRTRDALRSLGAIDRDGKITDTGMAMYEAYAHGLRAMICCFDTKMRVDWNIVRRDAFTGVRDMIESASLNATLERLIKATSTEPAVVDVEQVPMSWQAIHLDSQVYEGEDSEGPWKIGVLVYEKQVHLTIQRAGQAGIALPVPEATCRDLARNLKTVRPRGPDEPPRGPTLVP